MATTSTNGASTSTTQGEHSGGQASALTGGSSKMGDHYGPVGGGTSAQSARQFLIALAVLIVFVLVMTMLAGMSPGAGRGITLFFVAMLVLQGITHVNPFVQWVESHPLTPSS